MNTNHEYNPQKTPHFYKIIIAKMVYIVKYETINVCLILSAPALISDFNTNTFPGSECLLIQTGYKLPGLHKK
jgi:hypothetical protein